MSRSYTGRPKHRHQRHGGLDRQVSERTMSRDQAQESSATPRGAMARPLTFDSLEKNTIVLARILQDDGVTVKARPCVVVESAPDHLVVHPVTSSALAAGRVALEIDHWDESGLRRPSAVLHRLLRVDDVRAVLDVMGTLHPADATRLDCALVTTVSAIPDGGYESPTRDEGVVDGSGE